MGYITPLSTRWCAGGRTCSTAAWLRRKFPDLLSIFSGFYKKNRYPSSMKFRESLSVSDAPGIVGKDINFVIPAIHAPSRLTPIRAIPLSSRLNQICLRRANRAYSRADLPSSYVRSSVCTPSETCTSNSGRGASLSKVAGTVVRGCVVLAANRCQLAPPSGE